ncbi:metallopeptidase [Grosmannia clavigera kw1407]|uniref:Metallopeptidase n=1 Tax=Grosmannia clavigera (strain kw1407 / UAMH 11150) TaxID=655863 RepID=F0XTT5_GROCL|nr:metallopeptidase [Grosmannia clavigera kw1407]EFW98998.1 metallopeptidase [Grosmannia clavigera kw1407]
MKQLNDLVRECTRNMSADASGLWLSWDELEGVLRRVLDRLTDKGPVVDSDIGNNGSDNIGKLWLPTKVAFSSPVTASATCEATRKKVYYAVVNRMLVNVPLFREVVLLRDETARMLGFRHHAALKAAGNMMQTPEAVRQLLSEISDVLHRLASIIRYRSPETHEELEAMNLTELFNRTRADIYQIHGGEALDEGWEWGHGESVFRNVLNGYDAEYCSYILGRVFALDLFDVGFKHDSTSKDAGRRYRDMVIVKGGSQPEMKTLTDFLGHRPSTGPYLAWLRSP